MDILIKIRDRKFQIGLFNKRDPSPPSPFCIVRMLDKSGNIPSNIVYSATGAEFLRNVRARATNKPDLFSTAVKPLFFV